MATSLVNDWERIFVPELYLQVYYSLKPTDPENHRAYFLQHIHRAIQSSPELAGKESVSVLDYGCGPVICNVISALGLPNVSELVLAEYTARNRDFMKKWLEGDSSGFDWRPYFKHVVQTLEGGSESQVIQRADKIRKLAKLVQCDIDSADHIIEKGFEGPYDIVISFLCFDGDCQTIEEYNKRIARLVTLIKPGGTIIFQTTFYPVKKEALGTYPLGDEVFHCIQLVDGQTMAALRQAGVEIISTESLEISYYSLKLLHGRKLEHAST